MQKPTPPRYRPPLKPARPVEGQGSGFVGRCPYLGTLADAGTALGFPSDANRCYSTRLPAPVSAVQQQDFCLNGNHAECPVFQQAQRERRNQPPIAETVIWGVPQEATITDVVIAPARQSDSRRPAILPVLLILALVAGGWWLWRSFLSQPDSASESQSANLAIGGATATPDTIGQGAAPASSGEFLAAVNPTETPVPSATPRAAETTTRATIDLPVVPTLPAAADVAQAAECAIPGWWVPYVVQADDTVLGLAQLRGLAVDDVLLGNCLTSDELVAGQIVLLPPLAVVIGLTPTALPVAATRIPAGGANSGSVVIVATQAPATVVPSFLPSPTPFPTEDSGPPNVLPTSPPTPVPPTPVPPTAESPTRVPPTPTAPPLFPTATPPPPALPTATPPQSGPSPTPPPVRP